MPEAHGIPKSRPAASRLARLKRSPELLHYLADEILDSRRPLRLSVYGIAATREIFIEVTDGETTRIASFTSRMKDPTANRHAGLILVDLADAFYLARQLSKHWERTIPGFTASPFPRT